MDSYIEFVNFNTKGNIMRKYKLLGIAPYEGFKGYLLNSLKKREDIEADVYSAELDSAVDLVNSLDLSRYDAVISRGRTGRMVQNVIDIPFVNVEFSGYDLLRSLKLAQFSQNKKIAFVTFFDLVQNVEFLTELLEYKENILIPPSPDSTKELEELVYDLYTNQGVQLFIGDGACVECAKSLGAETILITSGSESMDKAIDEAVDIMSYKKKFEKKNQFYHSLLEQADMPISLFDKEGNLVYSKLFSAGETSELHNSLKKYIQKVFSLSSIKFIKTLPSGVWKVTGKLITIAGEHYALFSVSRTYSYSQIKTLSFEIVDSKAAKDCSVLIQSSTALSETWNKVKLWSHNKTPVLIYGGIGVGKTTFAHALYSISEFSTTPLINIECMGLDLKNLSLLFEDEKSPLYENDYTILFSKINLLSDEVQNKLSMYLSDTKLCSRNKVIATFSGDMETAVSSNSFSRELYIQLSGLSVYIPPLHERKEDIASIVRSFLTTANQEMPVQIVGFEADAMEILKNNVWDYGITQLHFVLKQLVLIAKHQFINADEVTAVLSQSAAQKSSTGEKIDLDITKTLDEISKDIINLVLKDEKGNQSKTARRLGISRSTLWKKLNS